MTTMSEYMCLTFLLQPLVTNINKTIFSSYSLACQPIKGHRCKHKTFLLLSIICIVKNRVLFYIFDVLSHKSFLFILLTKNSFIICLSALRTWPSYSRCLPSIYDIIFGLWYRSCSFWFFLLLYTCYVPQYLPSVGN